jgi:hypothetical protein
LGQVELKNLFMILQNWTDIILQSLQNLWLILIGFLPSLVGAFVIVIVGLIVAAVLERVAERIIYYVKIDALLRKVGVEAYLQRAHLTLNTGHFIGRVIYWFLLLAFLLAASDILGFAALSGFLRDVLNYIPNILVAILILLASIVFANFLKHLVRASVLSARLHAAKALGTLTWWAVIIFGLLTALLQLGIAVSIINTVITGLIAMLALGGGLAFGLGGREYAAHLIERLREEIENKG